MCYLYALLVPDKFTVVPAGRFVPTSITVNVNISYHFSLLNYVENDNMPKLILCVPNILTGSRFEYTDECCNSLQMIQDCNKMSNEEKKICFREREYISAIQPLVVLTNVWRGYIKIVEFGGNTNKAVK